MKKAISKETGYFIADTIIAVAMAVTVGLTASLFGADGGVLSVSTFAGVLWVLH